MRCPMHNYYIFLCRTCISWAPVNLKHLRTFVTVAEQGSLSKAALRLRISQPALSRQIIDLERELGLHLFDRVGRGLVLSQQGEHILKECRGVLSQTALLAEQAQLLRGGDAGWLRIAASPQILESVLSKFLVRYTASFPKVSVRFTEAVGADQLKLLERGESDIAIAIGLIEAASAENPFSMLQLGKLEILAAFRHSLQLGHRASIEISQFERHPLLVLDANYAFRRLFDRACRRAGIQPYIAIESRAPHTLLAFAEAGYGIAIIQSAVATDRYRLRVVRVTHRRKAITAPMMAMWDKRRKLPPYAEAFNRLLTEYMGKALPIAQLSNVRSR